ncbi:NAD(P)-binding protein [Peniophora sp. CONT]|nr:NAD(P)-binding protein [Peniophora sp. CONT]
MAAHFTLPARRVAIVTGAARGIGRSIALRLGRDGHDVAVADLRGSPLHEVAREIELLGRRSLALYTDVTKEIEVEKLVSDVAEDLGSVDIMIANAGIARFHTVLNAHLEDYRDVMTVNAQGVFLCYKHAALKMVGQGRGGRIIGASSITGKTGDKDGFAYCASKFAIRGMTQAAALELAKHNITVNAYAPNLIETDMARDGLNRVEGLKERFVAAVPLGRIGTSDDIAGCVSWLTSQDAGFVTGQSININGGMYFD